MGITQPIDNSFKTVEKKLGYSIVTKKVSNHISGFQYKIGNKNYIFINNNHTLGRQNHTLWHEVYYLYTRDGKLIDKRGTQNFSIAEFKADQFASQLLMDKDLVKNYVEENNILNTSKKYFNEEDIIRMLNYFHVSFNDVRTRLEEIYEDFNEVYFNFDTLVKYDELLELTKELGYDSKLLEVPKENYISPELFIYLKDNMVNGKISSKRVSEILNFLETELEIIVE